MMELGNLAFGHSRGEYRVPRNDGFEEELQRLVDAIPEECHCGYMADYENETFSIHPYWWGECQCGWDAFDDGQETLNGLEHRADCYRHEYRAWREKYGLVLRHECPGYWRELREMYERRGWDAEAKDWWHGCALRCSCDYDERYGAIMKKYAEEFGHDGHLPDCGLVRPNFEHKPSGLSIMVYKIPLRDSFSNKLVTLQEFIRVIDSCIASLKG